MGSKIRSNRRNSKLPKQKKKADLLPGNFKIWKYKEFWKFWSTLVSDRVKGVNAQKWPKITISIAYSFVFVLRGPSVSNRIKTVRNLKYARTPLHCVLRKCRTYHWSIWSSQQSFRFPTANIATEFPLTFKRWCYEEPTQTKPAKGNLWDVKTQWTIRPFSPFANPPLPSPVPSCPALTTPPPSFP